MGVSKLFDISRRSLLTYQAALNATSNNISNASNPDYSRQRVILSAERPEYLANLSFGSGVKLDDIQRVRDTLIDTLGIFYRLRIIRYYQRQVKQKKLLEKSKVTA